MKNYTRITPEGTRDVLFEECVARRNVEKNLSSLYKLRGYHRMITPTIEFYDVFDMENSGMTAESMYKLTDSRGRLIVLRPDSTIPIARLAATRLKDMELPLRLYYTQSVFRVNTTLSGRSDETAQSGIELIGAAGIKSDLEIISTAVNALESCGVGKFCIEIGHAGFFKALCSELGVERDVRDELIYLFETKNYVAVNEILDTLGDSPMTRTLREMPRMFGGPEILDKAQAMVSTEKCNEALDYLREIYTYLQQLGLEENVVIDLGLIQRTNYYTGIIFRGYIHGSGITVLSGGRYDNLLKEFGNDLPAIGFGIEVDALTKVLLGRESFSERVPERLVYADTKDEIKALKYIFDLNNSNVLCENSVQDTLDDALSYAKERGIKFVDVVGSDGNVKTLEVE